VVIVGPTASGKSAVALALAERLRGEILSADSLAVYRGFDIGAAKPTTSERRRVVHHGVDVADPHEPFTAADFARVGDEAIAAGHGRGSRLLVVGGTGLYVRALVDGLWSAPPSDEGLRQELLAQEAREGGGSLHRSLAAVDPATAQRVSPRDLVRVVRALEVLRQTGRPLSEWHQLHALQRSQRRYSATIHGVAPPREQLVARIAQRVDAMVEQGLVGEVRRLLDAGVSPAAKPMGALGYRHVLSHLRGERSLDEALAALRRDTLAYARRQLTWFRADPTVRWHASADALFDEVAAAVLAATPPR
jgi:tRNA dimethylallyltransferase